MADPGHARRARSEVADAAETAGLLALRDHEGVLLAVVRVTDRYRPDREAEAEAVLDTTDPTHPGVDHLLRHTHDNRLGGPVEGIELPTHYDFTALRLTPEQTRAELDRTGHARRLGLATTQPLHRAGVERIRQAASTRRGDAGARPDRARRST